MNALSPPDPTNGSWVLLALMLLVLAPTLEEYVLRGGLHQALVQRAAGAAQTASRSWLGHPKGRGILVAGAFALLHLPRGWVLALAVLPAGLLLSALFERFRSWRRCALAHAGLNALWLLLALAAAPVHADALRGKTLYSSSPPSGGATCAGCHGSDPTQNISKILRGANNAALITSAINGNTGGMGILKNKWTATDINDIALYLGNPGVTGAPAASVSPASLVFAASIVNNAATAQQVTLSNTGNAALAISGLSLSGSQAADFSASGTGACVAGGSLAAGSSCTVSVGFTPLATGTRTASLAISHALGSSTVALSGTGAAAPQATISLNQNLLNFGAVTQGSTSAAQTLIVSNSGQAALQLSGLNISGVAAGIYNTSGSCVVGSLIAVGASCTIDVRFAPNAIASFNGSLQLVSNASNGTVSVTLQGSGTAVPAPVLGVTPASLAFGNQTVGGTSGTQVVTVQNTGNAAASIGAVSLSGSSMFTLINPAACGSALAAGASCSLQLQFKPTATGIQSASLNVTSNAAGSPHAVSMSGTGVSQPTPSPSLSQSALYSFADTTVGQRSTVFSATAGNAGSAAYTITQVSLSGALAADFLLSGDCSAGKLMASGSSCTLSVQFAPSAVGLRQARINLVTDGGTTLGFDVQGNGKAVATVNGQLNPARLDFGAVITGNSSATLRSTLVNTGNQILSIASIAGGTPFVLISDSTTCPVAPFSLAPGLQCDLALRYVPAKAGTDQGSLSVVASAPGPTLSLALSGSATDPAVAPPSSSSSSGASTSTTTDPVAPAATSDAGTATNTGVSKVSVNGAPLNAGAGGCTMSPQGNDLSMLLLLIAALLTGWWRGAFRAGAQR